MYAIDIVKAFLYLFLTHHSFQNVLLTDNIDTIVESATLQAITDKDDNETVTLPDLISASSQNYINYTTIMNSLEHEFSNRHSLTKHKIYNFWKVWHKLNTDRGLSTIGWENCCAQIPQRKSIMFTFSPPRSGWSEGLCKWFRILAWYDCINIQFLS